MQKTISKIWINNAIRAVCALLFCNFMGFLAYMLVFNIRNHEAPDTAAVGTGIFSIILFALSLYFFYRIAMMGTDNSHNMDERTMLEKAYKDSNYTLDYNTYFKEQVKTRLWAYYLVAAISQIPLIINYCISTLGKFDTIYECPVINFYKFNMISIFGYELLGKAWYLGPIVFLVPFIVIFTFLVYRGQKKWMVKPSYIK